MKTIIRAIALALMLLLLCVLVPSPALIAGAEEAMLSPLPTDGAAPYMPTADGYAADGSGYADESITVSIRTERSDAYETDVMIVDIDIKDVSQLRTARAGKYGSKATAAVTDLAKRNNAVIAMNGDYFAYHDSGYVVRNGQLLRDRPASDLDILIIDGKGDMHMLVRPTREMVDAFDGDILQAFSFGPAMIIDGQKVAELGESSAADKVTQRIALCQRGPLSYSIVATEGPENAGSRGLTIYEFVDYLAEKGEYQQAYNFDGGSSSTISFNGQKINAVSTNKIRQVGDIIYFATLVNSGEAAN